jgi:hypothetical protein
MACVADFMGFSIAAASLAEAMRGRQSRDRHRHAQGLAHAVANLAEIAEKMVT